jgi:hypothetical protein
MNTKTCTKCGETKPATTELFYKSKTGKYGLKSECKVCQAEYNAKHNQKPEVKKRKNERNNERYDNNIQFKLSKNLRNRLNGAIKLNTKSASTLELLGCAVEYLEHHLESQFTEGMSWDNHGEWHIDHIIPIDSFDLTDPAQQRECFHFTNLQPLWAKDNWSKGGR